jgi:alkylresorcinol/alkylpyrone synthase
MFFSGLGTSTPPYAYAQSDCWRALEASPHFEQLTSRSRAILKKVLLGNNGICTRHLALNPLGEAFDLNPDSLHRRFVHWAPRVAAEAADRALVDAGLEPEAVDAVVISTCTGYLCPGLTSYVAERLGLRPDVLPVDLVGQGCGAALPNWEVADGILCRGRCRVVLSLCVEICSAAFFLDNDPGVLISACLFGDGAGAAVLTHEPIPGKRRVQWKGLTTRLDPARRDLLRFEHERGMLRNILTPEVPSVAAKLAGEVLDRALEAGGLKRSDIHGWILHAGGRDVLVALREGLGVTARETSLSAGVLRDYGNLSSPCVYFVLQAALEQGTPDGFWWTTSFGAGFACHGAMLEVG